MVTGIGGEREGGQMVSVRGGGSSHAVRRLSPPACRCRPGEIATWVRLDLRADQADVLRDVADSAGISVDAWVAVMVEFSAALDVLAAVLGSVERARGRLSQAVNARPMRVAALPEWRTWQRYLARRVPTGVDELPEVVLPQRLLARGGGTIDLARALAAASDWSLARGCELVACGCGQVLEAFALEAGLVGSPAAGR
jgi:hypothetical protein